jgi:hypothetical protein
MIFCSTRTDRRESFRQYKVVECQLVIEGDHFIPAFSLVLVVLHIIRLGRNGEVFEETGDLFC